MTARTDHHASTREPVLFGIRNRILQAIARHVPGSRSFRIGLHRLRGVHIGAEVFIGLDVILETSFPQLISIGNDVVIGLRSIVLAHFEGDIRTKGVPREPTVWIEDGAFVGPGSIVLPHVRIGRGSVVAAGSVVTRSVPPMRLVQGNPAKVVAKCHVPFGPKTDTWTFLRSLEHIEK